MQTAMAPTPYVNGSVQRKTESPAYQVYKTKDYSRFKLMSDNRNLNLIHLKRLVESFKQKHLISPIIVNEKMEVIDGQHRLEASKETGLNVYYIVIPGYSINEVQILNTNQKNWTKVDFLNMYCDAGERAYLQFKKFMNDFPDFQIQASERILTFGGKGVNGIIGGIKVKMKDFEEGKLVIPNLQKSYLHARKLSDIKPHFASYNRGTFVSAMLPLFESKKYLHKEMLHKLSNCPIKLTDCNTVEAYRMLVEDIYNYKRQKETKVSFRYQQ